jgi:hypothetical protein
VPEAEEGGAEAELQYVEVLEDTEGAQGNLADEGRALTNAFFKVWNAARHFSSKSKATSF